MDFKKSLCKGTYLISFFLLLSFALRVIEIIIQYSITTTNVGSVAWNPQVWLPLLLIVVISKLLLVTQGSNANPLNYFHYFGVYKLILEIRNIVFLVSMYLRYSEYPKEHFAEQIQSQIISIVFNIILGIGLIYWGYKYYFRHSVQ